MTRRLVKEEILIFLAVVAGAGVETTGRLFGWMGKLLAENPDQRREVLADRSLIPNTVEELLRIEPPGPHVARYVTEPLEYYGQTVPAGSAMLLMLASANHDERRFPDPERFDIHRKDGSHVAFGYGVALLPGCGARSTRRSDRARRGPQPVPGVGRRPGERASGADVDGARLGLDAGGHPLSASTYRCGGSRRLR